MISFIDLKTQQERIAHRLREKIDAVLRHGQYIMGPEVAELEGGLAAYAGVKHCIAVASGTDALLVALMAAGVSAGDEVVTTPFTFVATAETVALLGARPVFADIDPHTCNIDVDAIGPVITSRTKAIIPVSLYGQCADMDSVNRIAAKHGLVVIEDAAQSFGATYKGRRSCSLSTIGCTSFFPSKPLGAYGDGGACFTDDDELASKIRRIRVHGQERRYHHTVIGVNGRMDTLQAAILLAKMEIFPQEVADRWEVGNRYGSYLEGGVQIPVVREGNTSVFAQYTILVEHRDQVQSRLKRQGIPTAVHYPVPLHLQPVFSYLGYPAGAYPAAEAAAKKVMSLPMHPYLQEDEIAFISRNVLNAL